MKTPLIPLSFEGPFAAVHAVFRDFAQPQQEAPPAGASGALSVDAASGEL